MDQQERWWSRVRPGSTRGWITLVIVVAALVLIIGGSCLYFVALAPAEQASAIYYPLLVVEIG